MGVVASGSARHGRFEGFLDLSVFDPQEIPFLLAVPFCKHMLHAGLVGQEPSQSQNINISYH